MTLEEADNKFQDTLKDFNAAGFTVLTSIFIDSMEGYRLVEVVPECSMVIVTDKEPFKI